MVTSTKQAVHSTDTIIKRITELTDELRALRNQPRQHVLDYDNGSEHTRIMAIRELERQIAELWEQHRLACTPQEGCLPLVKESSMSPERDGRHRSNKCKRATLHVGEPGRIADPDLYGRSLFEAGKGHRDAS